MKILIGILCILTTEVSSLSSSSYLITKTAIKFFDFEEAYSHFKSYDIIVNDSDLDDKLETLINLNFLSEAKDIAQDILKKDNNNQKAWVVYLAHALIHNNTEVFKNFRKKTNKKEMTFVNFIFFDDKEVLKKNEIIARSIFEIVQASASENPGNENYSFLLFYLCIANLLDSNFNEAYFYSAQIYQILKNYYKAESLYKKVSVNHNLYIESQKNIAINKSKIGLFEEGEEHLLELIKNYSNQENIFVALADLYRIEKKYKKAIIYYSKIINSKKNSFEEIWRLLYLRGICYERLSKWNLAEKDFLLSLKINPNSPQVLNYLAYGWIERDYKLDQAIQMLKKASNANPQSFYILDSLAWGYFKKNQLKKAAKLMENVIVLAPGEAISLDHLGDIYFAMKRKREAKFFWRQALDLATPEDMITDLVKQKIEKHNEG